MSRLFVRLTLAMAALAGATTSPAQTPPPRKSAGRGNEGSNEPPWEWLTSQYASMPRQDIRFLLEVGDQESQGALGGEAPSILETNRRLRDALRKKGYAVTYAEVPGGSQSQATWRQRLPAAIAALAAPALAL